MCSYFLCFQFQFFLSISVTVSLPRAYISWTISLHHQRHFFVSLSSLLVWQLSPGPHCSWSGFVIAVRLWLIRCQYPPPTIIPPPPPPPMEPLHSSKSPQPFTSFSHFQLNLSEQRIYSMFYFSTQHNIAYIKFDSHEFEFFDTAVTVDSLGLMSSSQDFTFLEKKENNNLSFLPLSFAVQDFSFAQQNKTYFELLADCFVCFFFWLGHWCFVWSWND